MNLLKHLTAITLVLSIIHASVAIDDGDRKQLFRSKLIATLDHDRKLGGSKSSKAFGGKGSKKSAKSSKASRQSSDGSKPSTQSNANTPGKKQIFQKRRSGKSNKSGKSNSAKSNKSGKNFAAKSSKSSSSHQATKPNPPAPAPVRDSNPTQPLTPNDFDFTFPTPTPPAPGPSSISDSSTNTDSNNSGEDIVRQFLDNENEYHGLHAQNLAVGIVAALAVTATVAAVALKRKGKSLWPKGRVAENSGALDAGGMPSNATVKPAAVKSGDAAAAPVGNNDTFCPQDTWFDNISSCWV